MICSSTPTHRKMRGVKLLLLTLVACGGGGSSDPTPDSAPPLPDVGEAAPVTVYVVRHAETGSTATDPPLDATGQTRAQALATLLADDNIGLVLASQFMRTQLTGEPTATAAGISVTVAEVGGNALTYGEQLETMVRAAGVGSALIVGHSNTVPQTVKAFTGMDVDPIEETEFDKLFTITVRGPTADVIVGTY